MVRRIAPVLVIVASCHACPAEAAGTTCTTGNKVQRLICKVKSKAGSEARAEAIGALGKLGPAAKPALPVLFKAVDDPEVDVRYAAQSALPAIGAPAAAFLCALVKDTRATPEDRATAIWFLGLMTHEEVARRRIEERDRLRTGTARDKHRAVPAPTYKKRVRLLMATTQDKHRAVRAASYYALGKIGKQAAPAVPLLVTALDGEQDPGDRAMAAEALGRLGPELAAAAIPGLIRGAQHKDKDLRASATKVIGKLGPKARAAIPAVLRQIRQTLSEVGSVFPLVEIAVKIGGTRQVVRTLVAALASKKQTARLNAVEPLGKLGPAAKAALPALRKMAARERKSEASEAIEQAIWDIGRIELPD
jgi:HEAT repeat protein